MGRRSGESVAGEGNEEMAMGGVTVGNRTGMVGTGAESQAADGGLVLRRGGERGEIYSNCGAFDV